MTRKEKITELQGIIRSELGGLITSDFVLLACPYHSNIGDTLIWEGELAFFRECGRRMLAFGAIHTWNFRPLDKETIIVLHGGGNFGDIWPDAQNFALRVIESYPDNPIIVFPQTVFYYDMERAENDALRMARHPRLTICARDGRSFGFLKAHFRNTILLVPDLAFCIPQKELQKYLPRKEKYSEKALLLERTDKEIDPHRTQAFREKAGFADRNDWPTMERTTRVTKFIYKLHGMIVRYDRKNRRFRHLQLAALVDFLAMNRMRQANVRDGVRFMAPYRTVYSTRLHGVILALMMDRETFFLDNNYGKLSDFYQTWLSGTEGIEHIQLPEKQIND